jgi:hypothetical protein
MIANIIKIIHLVLVFFIIIAPFINSLEIKKHVLVFLLYLLFQYLTGYNRCGLTQLEYYVMGEEYQEGFLYRIINPIIKIPEKYFEDFLYLFHVIYVLILIYQLQ